MAIDHGRLRQREGLSSDERTHLRGGTFQCRLDRTPASTAVLRYLDAAGLVCADHVATTADSFDIALTDAEIDLIEEHGVEVERLERLVPLHERDVGPVLPSAGVGDAADALATGFVSSYLDAAQVASRIAALTAEFPSLCQLTTLPHTTSGYDGGVASLAGPASVQLLRITDDPASTARPGFLLVCGTHAREWINPLVAIEFAEQLLRNYNPASADPAVLAATRIVAEGDIFIVPVLNPDGLNFSVHDDAGWRKNRRPNGAAPACPGVDNNRNFEVYFGGAGSSTLPCTDSFRGSAAFSEPENLNVRHILEQHPNILVGVDCHSFGEDVFRPGIAGGTFIPTLPVSAADEAIYASLESTLVAAIQSVNGVTYSTGTTSNHAGTSDEYLFFAHRAFGFNLECALSFQPPIAQALATVAEVTAGIRALASATLDLDPTTPIPSRIVQCIDRTGSMVTFGYEAPARANAKRFIDMMSLGDSAGVVSFADPSPDPTATPPSDRATVHLPLTSIDDPGDFATARASVDSIAFGGWTPIGAGLQKAASELAGTSAPHAVVLLSDGFENREPWTSSVLATFPPGLPVYTIALGPIADVALLQSIATATGGIFYSSPTALELHEIYNQIRADTTDDGLVLNDAIATVDRSGGEDHAADVEVGADRLLVSVSWNGPGRKAAPTVIAPSGRPVRSGDWGVRLTRGPGYALVSVTRPMPGRWHVAAGRVRDPYVAAAFVGSPLRLDTSILDKRVPALRVRASFDGRPLGRLSGLGRVVPATTQLSGADRREPWSDTLPPGLELVRKPSGRVLEALPLELEGAGGREVAFTPAATLGPGVHNVRVRVEGELPGGAPFVRTVLRTVAVPDKEVPANG